MAEIWKTRGERNETLKIINRDVVGAEGSRRTRWVGLVAMAIVGVRERERATVGGCVVFVWLPSKEKLLLLW